MSETISTQPFDKVYFAKVVSQLRIARINLFILAIFTTLNVILISTGSTIYMLFSASIPYFFAQLGAELCGFFPEEYYAGYEMAADEFLPLPFFFICLGVAVLIIGAYLVCAFLSKKYTAGFIAALVMFSIDTVAMFVIYGISPNMILDIVFHIWVIVYLVMGIVYSVKYKRLAPQAELAAMLEKEAINQQDPSERQTSPMLRYADMEVKSRVFVEASAEGHTICYRHLKKCNELVIDGKVYAEYPFKLIEQPHMLVATIDGHKMSAGYDGGRTYIAVDDYVIASKVRLV